jgi:hypothetical protein
MTQAHAVSAQSVGNKGEWQIMRIDKTTERTTERTTEKRTEKTTETKTSMGFVCVEIDEKDRSGNVFDGTAVSSWTLCVAVVILAACASCMYGLPETTLSPSSLQ